MIAEAAQLTKQSANLLQELHVSGKNDNSNKLTPLNTLKTMFDDQLLPTYEMVDYVESVTNLCSHRSQEVRTLADEVLESIINKISPNSVGLVLNKLFECLKLEKNWKTRTSALQTIGKLTDIMPVQISLYLPVIVPELSNCVSDPKLDVKNAAFKSMTMCCDIVGNKDIEHMTEHIIKAIQNPSEINDLIHELASVVFIQSVTSSALAIVVPLLNRGLSASLTATRRQSAVIIENMSKLVDDPLDALPFLPKLLPTLIDAHDRMSNPEAASVLERSLDHLIKLNNKCKHLKSHAINVTKISEILQTKGEFGDLLMYLSYIIDSLTKQKDFTEESWNEISEILINHTDQAAELTQLLSKEIKEFVKIPDEDNDDDAELLCNCQFTLAYGTKILLHNTTLKLRRGKKYALIAKAQGGKSTFMRSIANNSLEGFPDQDTVRTVFMKSDIIGELSHLDCIDYVMQNENLKHMTRDEVINALNTVGFTDTSPAKPTSEVGRLSGGWRCKLGLITALLQHPDVLLLDNPSSHLDVENVIYVKNYINSLKDVTCIMTSNDVPFLRDCCTNVLQIDNLKLHQYSGGIDGFIEKNADCKEYFSMKETSMEFSFPKPSEIQGVKSKSKALMKMSDVTFTYPTNTVPTVFNINLYVSMVSKIAVVGKNGGGKSTTIKLLIGELEPQSGKVDRNPNGRVAYISQHSFEQINRHLDKTANEYIRYRFSTGDDKESIEKVEIVLTPEEEKLQGETFEYSWKDDEDGSIKKAKKRVTRILENRKEVRGSGYEYEVKCADGTEMYMSGQVLSKQGWTKHLKALDVKIAQLAGRYIRTLTSSNVESHLAECGLPAEKATHTRLSSLSDSEKCMAVIGACTWAQPHILVFDEPTNYLSNDLLNGFAKGLLKFEGGYVIISHNNEFTKQVCKTEWHMEDGRLVITGEDEQNWMDKQTDKANSAEKQTHNIDALGNVTEIKQKKILSKRDIKQKIKDVSKKIKSGMDLDDDDFEFATEHKLV
jgi:elongation factor 3